MSDGSASGRGRARGRAGRGQAGLQIQQTRPPVTRAPQGPPPTAHQSTVPPGFQQQSQPQQQHMGGRAAHRGAGDPSASLTKQVKALSVSGPSEGASGGATAAGRGAMRGRRALDITTFKTRPETCENKQGSSGQKISLTSNYFKILNRPDYSLYHYHVDFAPQEDRTVVRRGLMRNHVETLGSAYIFDGGELYTLARLSPDPLQLYSKREHDGENIQLTLKLVAEVRDGDATYLQICNIIIRKCLRHLNLQLLNRNYYDNKARILINDHNLELWPGYITTIRQHDGGVLLCTEIVHKVLRKDTAYDVLEGVMRHDPGRYKDRFVAEVIGQIVLTQYGNTQTYKVDDVDFSVNPKSTFDMKGTQKSYVQYYKEKYNVTIRHLDQPLLLSRPTQRAIRDGRDRLIYLIPELCHMTGLTDNMRGNFNLMKALADHTRMSVEVRTERLRKFSERFHGVREIKEELAKWQLNPDKNLIRLEGRVLAPESIIQENKKFPTNNADWTRNLQSNGMLLAGVLDNWVVVVPNRMGQDTNTFIQMIIKVASEMRFNVQKPNFVDINDDKVGTLIGMLDKILSQSKPKLVMCIVSNNKADRYSAIKKKMCVDRPVPSQVLCHKTMTRKGAMSIATKVAIQLCCKIGGAPWTVDMPLDGLMVVGYDVCHDSSSKSKSYGAMVATLNKTLSRYFSTVTSHDKGEELSKDFAINMGIAIQKYRKVNNKLPSRIAIYRDGVGEGQIPQVMETEVAMVMESLKSIYQEQPIRMAFIIVTKRLNSRFFNGINNPPPGTIVDSVVTHPERYDFFLISQSVRQGSVSPTGFNIVYDTIGLDADKLQRLTYKLCHLYYNWSGTVRVPAPCQYAHKLAFLVGQNLHRTPNVELDELLYYL